MGAENANIVSYKLNLTKRGIFDKKNKGDLATGAVIEYFGSL